MTSNYSLLRKSDRLVRQITDNLDFPTGSFSTQDLKHEAYNLTTKSNEVTRLISSPSSS